MEKETKEEKRLQTTGKGTTCKYKNIEVIILVVSSALISFIFGYLLCTRFSKKASAHESMIAGELAEIVEAYEYIIDNYYGKINKEDLIRNAISGMIGSLGDANTTYISEEESNNFNALLDGTYDGIGVEIFSDGENIIITSVFEDTPASKTGIKENDIVISVNGVSTRGMNTLEVVDMIKANEKEIKLVIDRQGTIIEKTLNLETVILDSVTSKLIEKNNNKIGYIYISIFAANTYEQFEKHLRKLENQKIDSLIIDVRSNSGGHLSVATDILSLFLKSDKVIYQLKSSSGITKHYSTGYSETTYPIVVLVNGASASASEIVASALQEQYGAKLVGEKTYGKGTVQELKQTDSGIQYKVTTQHWLTPNGTWIDGTGIPVDYEVLLGENYLIEPNDINDNQLQKAIEILE